MGAETELSRVVGLADLDDGPVTTTVEASAEECAALAERYGIPAVSRVKARVTLTEQAGDVLLEGDLEATVTQSCVVTLEPVDSTIASGITVRYMSPDVFAALRDGMEEEVLDDETEDVEPLPDLNAGQWIDVGEVVAQYLALALEPYPRKPGVELDVRVTGSDAGEARPNPFDVLKKLQDRG